MDTELALDAAAYAFGCVRIAEAVEHDVAAGSGQGACDAEANAAGRAGHDCDTAFQYVILQSVILPLIWQGRASGYIRRGDSRSFLHKTNSSCAAFKRVDVSMKVRVANDAEF